MSLKNQQDRADPRAFPDDFSDYTRKPRNRRWRIATVSVLVVCAVTSVLVAVDYWANYGRIYRGVSIEGVSLGGKTPEEARGVVEERLADGLQEITLTGSGEEFVLTSGEMGVDFDIWTTVEEAYAVGRRGGVLERLGDRLETVWVTVSIPPVTDNDWERLRDALSEVNDAIEVEPVEAGFEIDDARVYVTGSRPGKEVDEEKLLEDLEVGLFEGRREYEVPVVAVEPELTTDEAERLKPTALIGTYRTSYTLSSDKSAERVENLKIASGAISGQALAPGEV